MLKTNTEITTTEKSPVEDKYFDDLEAQMDALLEEYDSHDTSLEIATQCYLEDFLAEVRNEKDYKKLNTQQKSFVEYAITTILYEHDLATVVCSPCGIGKSTAIKLFLTVLLRRTTETDGVIVVTDFVDSLEEYVKGFREQVAVLRSDNLSSEMVIQKTKKVLLMTTQRYFALSPEELIEFLTWNKGERTRILIDEKVQPFIQTKINLTNFDRMHAAIYHGMDNLHEDKKRWCLDQWEKATAHLVEEMDDYEKKCDSRLEVWHRDTQTGITENDELFESYLRECESAIKAQYQQFFTDLKAIKHIFLPVHGALFQSQKRKSKTGNEIYEKSFFIIDDNSTMISQVHKLANVIIFDATADLSPEYQLGIFNVVKQEEYARDLSKLKIDIVDVSTTKVSITPNTDTARKTRNKINAVIDEYSAQYDKIAVFTYYDIEPFFQKDGRITGHFGKLHGTNEYQKCDIIAHVGINRLPHIYYYLLDSMVNPKNNLSFIQSQKSVVKQAKLFDVEVGRNGEITRSATMINSMLADFEQNIMRSEIRTPDNQKEVRIVLFCSMQFMSGFVEAMRNRYEPLGTSIQVIKHPVFEIEKIMKRKGDNNAKLVLNWLRSLPDGTVFKADRLLEETGLNQKQFQKVKERNKGIPTLFKKFAEGQKRYYYKMDKAILDASGVGE